MVHEELVCDLPSPAECWSKAIVKQSRRRTCSIQRVSVALVGYLKLRPDVMVVTDVEAVDGVALADVLVLR